MEEGEGHVLVVEDDPEWRKILRDFLKEEGFKVRDVSDYEGARETLRQNPFQLATIDINLRESPRLGEGKRLLRHIKESYGDVMPCIVITGSGLTPEDAASLAIEYGIIGYIEKENFDYDRLGQMVRKAFGYTEDQESLDVQNLRRQIDIHRKNLSNLEERAALYGKLDVPIKLVNQIELEKEEIRRLETELAKCESREQGRARQVNVRRSSPPCEARSSE
jgi:DNA-binding NtrC family response regulator